MNIPNLLTLSRFALIPLYIAIFAQGYQLLAFCVVVVAGITDVLDGYIARKKGQITTVGIMLDPLADKLMMLTVMISLLVKGLIPWVAAAAMFLRDIGMIIGSAIFHFRGKRTVPANMMGKLTTVMGYAAILFIVLDLRFAPAYLWFVIVFSFVTSAIYICQFIMLNQKKGV